jgi:hypothetical protein
MKWRFFRALVVFAGLAGAAGLGLAGCSSSGTGESGEPGTIATTPAAVLLTDGGLYRVAIHSAPDAAPSRGVNTLRLFVTRASDGAPATELDLEVVPWMPAMGHGASVKPTVSPGSDPGSYDVSNVNLFMPGLWEIRTTIGGKLADHAAPQFDIR